MSDLPAQMMQRAQTLLPTVTISDPEQLRMMVQWGFDQIDVEYPEHAIFAPLNRVRKARARHQWIKVLQEHGARFRQTVLEDIINEYEFQQGRRRGELLAQDIERRRQDAMLFDSNLRLKEGDHIARRDHALGLEAMAAQHKYALQAEDAALERRLQEANQASELRLFNVVLEAVIQRMGPTSVDERIEAQRRIFEEIRRIRRDSDLTDEEKHLEIKALIDSMPIVLRGTRAHDV